MRSSVASLKCPVWWVKSPARPCNPCLLGRSRESHEGGRDCAGMRTGAGVACRCLGHAEVGGGVETPLIEGGASMRAKQGNPNFRCLATAAGRRRRRIPGTRWVSTGSDAPGRPVTGRYRLISFGGRSSTIACAQPLPSSRSRAEAAKWSYCAQTTTNLRMAARSST